MWHGGQVIAGLPVYPEDALEAARVRKRLRRNGVILIVILDLLVIAVGLSGAGDLRRMSTPAGAAAAWADAASAGDCDRYLDLETPRRRAADLAGITLDADTKSQHAGLCDRVVNAWGSLSTRSSAVVATRVGSEIVRITVAGPGVAPVSGDVVMTHGGGRWRVDLAPAPCVTPSYSPVRSLCSSLTPPSS